jgi:hypothetical protein
MTIKNNLRNKLKKKPQLVYEKKNWGTKKEIWQC